MSHWLSAHTSLHGFVWGDFHSLSVSVLTSQTCLLSTFYMYRMKKKALRTPGSMCSVWKWESNPECTWHFFVDNPSRKGQRKAREKYLIIIVTSLHQHRDSIAMIIYIANLLGTLWCVTWERWCLNWMVLNRSELDTLLYLTKQDSAKNQQLSSHD